MFDSSIAITQFCAKLCLKLSCFSISLKKGDKSKYLKNTTSDSSIRGELKSNMFTKFLTL